VNGLDKSSQYHSSQPKSIRIECCRDDQTFPRSFSRQRFCTTSRLCQYASTREPMVIVILSHHMVWDRSSVGGSHTGGDTGPVCRSPVYPLSGTCGYTSNSGFGSSVLSITFQESTQHSTEYQKACSSVVDVWISFRACHQIHRLSMVPNA
jgi:hypothetical protein